MKRQGFSICSNRMLALEFPAAWIPMSSVISTGAIRPIRMDFSEGQPLSPWVSYQENQLILAEAYLKQASADPVSALAALNAYRDYMNAGGYINTGYISLGASYADYVMADFAPGGIDNPASSGLTQQQALLKEILQEKYVSLIGQIEQFTDVRRTHNFIGVPPNVGTVLPQRFLYPQDEISTNPNTPALTAGALLTPLTAYATPY